MREALKIVNNSLPPFTLPDVDRISAQMAEWQRSDYAGFRRVLAGGDCAPDVNRLSSLAAASRSGIRDFVILGIGGSSLGAEAIVRALHAPLAEPRFHVADNSDPRAFRWLLDGLDPASTLFFAVAKSGSTPETLSQLLVARDWCRQKDWKKHFVFCTDPVKGDLRTLARRWGVETLDVPPAVGGRFTALTPVGLFPAAFAGLNVQEFLDGAASVEAWSKNWSENPAGRVAIQLAKHAGKYPITVLMPYSSQLSAYSRWFCQLWAESLGKGGHGLTPYPAVGATDQHSQMQLYMEGPRDKCIVFVHDRSKAAELPIPFPAELRDLPSFALLEGRSVGQLLDAEFRATRDAVTGAGIPNCTLEIDRLDAYSLGALFYFWEMATAIAGAALGVNPFDQPGVEAAKILTKKYLAK